MHNSYKNTNNNFDRFWKNWNVLQTPKIDLNMLAKDGYVVYDSSNLSSTIINNDTTVVITYLELGGIQSVEITKSGKVIYHQLFNSVLRPNIEQIYDMLDKADISRRYLTTL